MYALRNDRAETLDAKRVFQSVEKDSVANGIKRCAQIQQSETWDMALLTSSEEVTEDMKEGSFSGMMAYYIIIMQTDSGTTVCLYLDVEQAGTWQPSPST